MAGLIEGVHAAKFVGQLGVDVLDGLQNPLAEVFRLVAVAEFPSFMHAGAGSAGNRRPAGAAVGQHDIDLDGRIAAAIENLAAANVNNRRTHRFTPNIEGIWLISVYLAPREYTGGRVEAQNRLSIRTVAARVFTEDKYGQVLGIAYFARWLAN